jgi:hypothetical protein
LRRWRRARPEQKIGVEPIHQLPLGAEKSRPGKRGAKQLFGRNRRPAETRIKAAKSTDIAASASFQPPDHAQRMGFGDPILKVDVAEKRS